MKRWTWAVLVGGAVFAGCGSSATTPNFGSPSDGGDDATASGDDGTFSDDGGSVGDDASQPHTCNPTSLDLSDCPCPTPNATRACYTGPPATRNVGLCKDGTQTCVSSNEFATWGPCTGSVGPAPEVCDGTVDRNCNGKTGCNDPTCTSTPLCNSGCTDGQTRACYTGPSGTENVGVCKDGQQVCANGQWGPCNGQVLPQPQNCCDAIDHACNGMPGCYNLFACITAACCQSSCDAGGGLDPGCVCMTGSGDTATCPAGDHYVHKGGLPGTDECCPCTVSNCGDYNCCGESVCAGNAACGNVTCRPLPSSCNGQVSADCDDFPEDCDEPCCECTDGTC
ncbi:MAG TPA: hypothetical protein VIF15_05455 [Polyangiaceae bacterium]|jgi:hypothetical protein